MIRKLVSKIRTAKKLGFEYSVALSIAKFLGWKRTYKSKYGYKFIPFNKQGFCYYHGIIERETFTAVNKLLQEESIKTFINVGCGFGEYILLASSKNINCVGFEPLPELYEIIQTNLQLNRINTAKMFNTVLSDINGVVDFCVNSWKTTSAIKGHENIRGKPKTIEIRNVQSLRFDDLNLELESPMLFLIDAEGSELQVLKGALKTIMEHKPLIIAEVDINPVKECAPILNVLSNYVKLATYDRTDITENVLLKPLNSANAPFNLNSSPFLDPHPPNPQPSKPKQQTPPSNKPPSNIEPPHLP